MSPDPGRDRRRLLLLGAVACAAYSVLQLLVNGPVLDETLVPSEIIDGTVVYPRGHPHATFYPYVFSLGNWLSALHDHFSDDAFVVSAPRNFLFLFLSTFTPFAVALALAGGLAATLAAAITTLEVHLALQGAYPCWVFPDFYSHGHLALSAAVLVPALLLLGSTRVAPLLLGLFPAIHGSYALVAIGFAVPWLAARWRGLDPVTRRRVLAWLSLGLVLTAALAGVIAAHPDPDAPAAPYDVAGEAETTRLNFMAFTDPHRRPAPLHTLGYFVQPLLFLALVGLLWSPERRRVLTWLLWLGAVAWIGVLLYRLVDHLPPWVEHKARIAMPNRYSNVTALLAVPLAAVAIDRTLAEASARRATALLLVLGALLSGVAFLHLTERRHHLGLAIFALAGVVLASRIVLARKARERGAALVGLLALVGGLLTHGPWMRSQLPALAGAAALTAIAVLAWPGLPALAASPPRCRRALTGLSVVLALVVLPGREGALHDPRVLRHDVISPDDAALVSWLARTGRPDEPILTPLYPRAELQPKTGHPVLLELETLWLMTYDPSVARVVGEMVKDLYGVDYGDRAALEAIVARSGRSPISPWHPVFDERWRRRTRGEWQALGAKYDFRLVWAHRETPLDLPKRLAGTTWNLYEIP